MEQEYEEALANVDDYMDDLEYTLEEYENIIPEKDDYYTLIEEVRQIAENTRKVIP